MRQSLQYHFPEDHKGEEQCQIIERSLCLDLLCCSLAGLLTCCSAKSDLQVLDLSGSSTDSRASGFGRVQISTFCVRHNLIAAGGFAGELIVADARQDSLVCRYLFPFLLGFRKLSPRAISDCALLYAGQVFLLEHASLQNSHWTVSGYSHFNVHDCCHVWFI